MNGAIFPSFSIFFGNVLEIFAGAPNKILSSIHPWAALLTVLGILSGVSIFVKVPINLNDASCMLMEAWAS